MAKPKFIELPTGERIAILYEDRSVLAIDKPAGWMLSPVSWQSTGRNLQAALMSSMHAGDFWAHSRNLKFLRFVHRLDAETSGVLLLAKSSGALSAMSALFESREMSKSYLAAVHGQPTQIEWSCRAKIGEQPGKPGRMRVDEQHGKDAETKFRVLQLAPGKALLEAQPLTGRTHQIRVHLFASGHPVVGDELYGNGVNSSRGLGLRATGLSYKDPFTKRPVAIHAPVEEFIRRHGFHSLKKQATQNPEGTKPESEHGQRNKNHRQH